jgi:hypothetical protein
VREHSRTLRTTSQQLRENLRHLRAYAAQVSGALAGSHVPPQLPELADAERDRWRTPLDFAAVMLQRVRRARQEARMLRRRAADLRSQAAEFRAHSENTRSNSGRLD